MNDWDTDIEEILECIRGNCSVLSEEHRKQYFYYENSLKYYKVPIIIISGVNSIISVGFQAYMQQKTISMTNCLLALFCSIIASVELYLGIQKKGEAELIASREYYLLGIDIQKTLMLEREKRPLPAKEYLEKCYSTYCKLFENSNVLNKKIHDKLTTINNGSVVSSSITLGNGGNVVTVNNATLKTNNGAALTFGSGDDTLTVSNSSAVGTWALITAFLSGKSKSAAGTILKLAAIGVISVPQ